MGFSLCVPLGLTFTVRKRDNVTLDDLGSKCRKSRDPFTFT